jgi:hypothetical protein
VISIWIGTAVSTDAAAGTWSGHAQITWSCTCAGKAVGAWKCTAVMCNGELFLYDKYKTIQVDKVSCLHVHGLINTVNMLYDVNFVGVFMVLPELLNLGSGGSDT